jgi:hypothetical protein
MTHKARFILTNLCLLIPSSIVFAQTSTVNKYSPGTEELREKEAYLKRHESSNLSEWQRALAISKITSLADEADAFKDQSLRVRVQARAADALWETDRVQSRRLFLRAWETAESIDKAGTLAAEDASKRVLNSRQGLTFIPPPPNLRSEVLNLAARRDQQLGEILLARLEESKEQDTGSKASEPRMSFFDPTEPPQAIVKRLELATELLKTGDVAKAKMIADPGLKSATSQGIIFLCALRQRDADGADERYSQLLGLSAKDQGADATTVSLLSSYIFTPNLLVTATKRGRVSNQWSESPITSTPPPGLRASFFRVAADILLRPLTPPDQDRTSAGRGGIYFTIARLLPLFEQYAPDQIPALTARLTLLAQDTPEVYKNNDNGMLTAGIVPEDPGRDDLSNILSQLSDTVGVGAHDLIYIKAVRAAAAKGDARVREFADRIENADLRKRARAFADFVMVRKALSEKDVEGVVRILGESELPPLQRVWAYTEAASLLKQSNASRALQILDQAASEAQTINNGELERVYALASVASHFFKFDRVRGWEIAVDAIKASNAVSDSAADDGKLAVRLQARGVAAMVNLDVPSFNLTNLFETLAKDDFERAGSLADTIKGEAPRATANLAIARSLLRKKSD